MKKTYFSKLHFMTRRQSMRVNFGSDFLASLGSSKPLISNSANVLPAREHWSNYCPSNFYFTRWKFHQNHIYLQKFYHWTSGNVEEMFTQFLQIIFCTLSNPPGRQVCKVIESRNRSGATYVDRHLPSSKTPLWVEKIYWWCLLPNRYNSAVKLNGIDIVSEQTQ